MPNWALNISESAPGVVQGIVIILVMLLAPGGVLGLVRRGRMWINSRRGGPVDEPPVVDPAVELREGPEPASAGPV
jgi:hypothetical protein